MTLKDGWFEPLRERLTLRRKQIGLSQRAAAAAAGLDPAAVCMLEGGYNAYSNQRMPGPVMLARWCHGLRVDTELTLRLHAAEWPEDFVVDLMDHMRF